MNKQYVWPDGSIASPLGVKVPNPDKVEVLPVPVKNVKQCSCCGGSVDRYPNHFECTNCGAIGDPVMGMMMPMKLTR